MEKKRDYSDKPVRMYMAARLRESRLMCGMSKKSVSDAIHKSVKTVEAYESGRSQPDADMLVDLCRLYGVSVAMLYPPEASEMTMVERLLVRSFAGMTEPKRRAILAVMEALTE